MSITKKQDGYCLIRNFLSPEELSTWTQLLDRRRDLFQPVASKAGLNMKYHVLNGIKIREHLPEFFNLAGNRLLETTQEFAGEKLEFMSDPKRSVRMQRSQAKNEGFKWHLDGGKYSALLILANTNQGVTEIISPAWSRILFPFAYFIFYWFQKFFQIATPIPIQGDAGDLLIMHGRKVLHRLTTKLEDGERIVLVATFNPAGTKPTPLWDRFAGWLNY